VNLPELRKNLVEQGVRRYAVSIDKVDETEEQYRLERDGRYWTTYYYERGERRSPRDFASEEDACKYFLEWVLGDPTTRSKREGKIEPKA
jgi:hypothetical protein